MYREKIVNVITGEETWRDYTAEEIAIVEATEAQEAIEKALRDADQASKNATRQSVLDKLGLTTDEVTALLG